MSRPEPDGDRLTGRPPGRPRMTEPPFSEEQRAEIMRLAFMGCYDAMIARAVGMNDTSLWSKWKNRSDPEFVRFFQEIEQNRLDGSVEMLGVVRKAATTGTDWKAAKYLLGCMHTEFSEQKSAAKAAADAAAALAAEAAAKAAEASELPDAFKGFSGEDFAEAARYMMERKAARLAAERSEPAAESSEDDDEDEE